MPTLELCFDKNLKSHLVYKVTCYEFSFIYVGETSWHNTIGISEHKKKDTPVGGHLVEYCGTAKNIECEILDSCCGEEK